MRRWLAGILLGLYTVVLLWLTLQRWSSITPYPPVQLIPFATIRSAWNTGGRAAMINIIGNVVAFVPLGFFGWLWQPNRRWWLVLGLASALSISIECVQWRTGYRVADFDDVLLNTFGCGIGMLLFTMLQRMPMLIEKDYH